MSTGAVTAQTTEASIRFKARMAGFFWFMVIVTGAIAILVGGRLGLAANLIATACYVVATVLVYGLLKPVNRRLSLLAAFFSFVGCAIGVVGMLSPPAASQPSFVFFGLHCLLVGYLILRSTFLPRFVGVLMAFGGLGWLALGLASVLAPPLARSLSPYIMIPGTLGEATLSLWLLVKGVNVQRWKEQASAAGEWWSPLATQARRGQLDEPGA